MAPATDAGTGSVRPGPSAGANRTPSAWNASGWFDVGATEPTVPGTSNGYACFAFDPTLNGDVYFGGVQGYAPANQTWLLNATGWHELAPSQSPPVLQWASMAWDASDDEMLLFGGLLVSAYSPTNVTWAYAHGTWTALNLSRSPPAAQSVTMFSDPDDGSVIVFGGYAADASENVYYSNATWQFRDGQWRTLNTTGVPTGREAATAAWDSSADEAILFGGQSYNTETGWTYYNDTWAYRYGAWTPLAPIAAPPARSWSAASDDPALGGVVLFGGDHDGSVWANDTWVFSGDTWTAFALGTAPPAGVGTPAGLAPGLDASSVILAVGWTSSAIAVWTFSTLVPTIAVEPSAQEGDVPLVFTSIVTGGETAENLSWDLGDGAVGYGTELSHLFAVPGEYNVTVVVTDLQGRAASATRPVGSYPVLSYTADATPAIGTAPLQIRFTATMSGGEPPYVSNWSCPTFAELEGAAGTLAIDVPGTYVLTFNGSDAAGYSVEESFQIEVLPAVAPVPLSASILQNVSSGPAPLDVAFVGIVNGGTPPYALSWSFGAGLTASGSPVRERLTVPGTYDAVLTVADAIGERATAQTSVQVRPAFYVHATVAGPAGAGSVTVEASGFQGTPPYAFYWSWGDGNGSAGPRATHTFSRAGNFSIELSGLDAVGHLAEAWANVSVGVPPPAPATATPSAPFDPLVALAASTAVVGALVGVVVVILRRGPPRDLPRAPATRRNQRPPRAPPGTEGSR